MRVCGDMCVCRIIEVCLLVAALSLLDCIHGMHVKVIAPFCSLAAGAFSLISTAPCHRSTRNLVLRTRVSPTVPSVTSMSSRKVENRLFSQSDASDSKLIALILNYKLPTQVYKLLRKGKACSSG